MRREQAQTSSKMDNISNNCANGNRLKKWDLQTVIVGVLLGIGAGWFAFHSKSTRPLPLIEVTSRTAPGAQPPNFKGLASSPVTLEEFSDFECPPCRDLYQTLKKIEVDYGPRLKVVFRHFPISSLHQNALAAARVSEAAALQGHFWEMHDELFEDQRTWSSSSDVQSIFLNYARSLQLDVDRFRRDMDGPQANIRVRADRQRGNSLGVPGTPTVLINDRQVPPEAVTYEGIHAAIDKLAPGSDVSTCDDNSDGCRSLKSPS